MNKKITKFIITITMALLTISTLATCGGKTVRKDVKPTYVFKEGEVLTYALKANINVNANAMIFQYTGDITITGQLELKAKNFDTNYGTKIELTIRNIKVQGADSRVNRVVMVGLNQIRTMFATFYITPDGKTTGLHKGRPHPLVSSYLQTVFPKFDNLDKMWNQVTVSTNYKAKYGKQEYTATFEQNTGIRGVDGQNMKIAHKMYIKVYEKEAYAKSVEPNTMGTVDISIDDIFDLAKNELTYKKADLEFYFTIPFRKGILVYNISVNGNGYIELKMVDEPQV